jgi:hypothetical protein
MGPDPKKRTRIPEPWWSFLREVDEALSTPVEVHYLGGFVLGVVWGLPRPTADVDVVEIRPSRSADELLRIAGDGSEISRKRGLHFQRVTIAECPPGYESRLTELAPMSSSWPGAAFFIRRSCGSGSIGKCGTTLSTRIAQYARSRFGSTSPAKVVVSNGARCPPACP